MKKFLYCLSIAFALNACATSNEKPALEKLDTIDTEEKVLPSEFLDAFQKSANESCISNGNSLDDCNCYTSEIISTFTADDFVTVFDLIKNNNVGNIISEPSIGEKIINASIKCFYKE